MERKEVQVPAQPKTEEVTRKGDAYQPPASVVVGKVDELTMGTMQHAMDGGGSTNGYKAK